MYRKGSLVSPPAIVHKDNIKIIKVCPLWYCFPQKLKAYYTYQQFNFLLQFSNVCVQHWRKHISRKHCAKRTVTKTWRAKELHNIDDPHCEKNPQKWPKLQCRMVYCVPQLIIKYKTRLESWIRIAHHISRITSTSRVWYLRIINGQELMQSH